MTEIVHKFLDALLDQMIDAVRRRTGGDRAVGAGEGAIESASVFVEGVNAHPMPQLMQSRG